MSNYSIYLKTRCVEKINFSLKNMDKRLSMRTHCHYLESVLEMNKHKYVLSKQGHMYVHYKTLEACSDRRLLHCFE
jgi:hypothetical protein